MIPIMYNVRNLVVRKTTTAAAALGLGLVVFVFASAEMLSNGVTEATRRAVDPTGAIVLRKGAAAEIESGIDAAKIGAIASAPGVARAPDGHALTVGEVSVLLILDKPGRGVGNVELRGVPDGIGTFRPSMRITEGRPPRPGTDEAVVGRAIRGRFEGLTLGEKLELRRNRPVQIVGVFEDAGSSYESEIWADVDLVRSAFGKQGVVSSVRARLVSEAAFPAFKAAVEANRELNVTAFREREFEEKQTRGTAAFVAAVGFLVAFLLSLGAIVGAMITMHATIADRVREIGTLRALGFSRGQVLASLLLESVALSLVGGLVGSAAALSMSRERISMVNTSTWSELSFEFDPTVGIMLTAILVATIMGILGGLGPAIRATRIDPARAMRGG